MYKQKITKHNNISTPIMGEKPLYKTIAGLKMEIFKGIKIRRTAVGRNRSKIRRRRRKTIRRN